MYKIYIDTTQRYEKRISIQKDNVEIDTLAGDIDVISSIEGILKKNKLTLQDIDFFDANPGPGSFTGIKIGITISNVLNWILGKNKPLIRPEYGREPNISERKEK